jgi:hypothetical protein
MVKLTIRKNCPACDTMHMYDAKNLLENREITLFLKDKMPFATETS